MNKKSDKEVVRVSAQKGFIYKKENDKFDLDNVYYICVNDWINLCKVADQLDMHVSEYRDNLIELGATKVSATNELVGFRSKKEAEKAIKEFVVPNYTMARLRRAK